jgi:hypothetical protein
LRLVAIGYPEICWLDHPEFALPPRRDDGRSIMNQPFRDWISGHGGSIPETARELVPDPATMGDLATTDRFCIGLNTVCNRT